MAVHSEPGEVQGGVADVVHHGEVEGGVAPAGRPGHRFPPAVPRQQDDDVQWGGARAGVVQTRETVSVAKSNELDRILKLRRVFLPVGDVCVEGGEAEEPLHQGKGEQGVVVRVGLGGFPGRESPRQPRPTQTVVMPTVSNKEMEHLLKHKS